MPKSHRPGPVLALVALVAGVIDLGFGLWVVATSLFDRGFDRSFGLLFGGGALGLAVLAAVAIEQSARGRRVLAWLLVIPPCLAAHALASGL